MSVRVRVVPVVEHRMLAWAAGLAGGALAIAYLGLGLGHQVGVGLSKTLVGPVLSAWIGGTLLSWRRRPYVARAEVEAGMLRAGALALPLDGGLAVHVARGARGFSIAVSRGREGAFLEVETEADARRLLGAMGVPWPGRGAVVLEAPHRGVRFAQRLSAAAGITSAMLYSIFVGLLGDHDLKGAFGFPALILGGIASVLFMFDAGMRRMLHPGAGTDPIFGESVVDAHTRLHDMLPVHADDPSPEPAVARVRVLEPAGEAPRAWLERIDALGRGEGGYRGDAPAAEELVSILEDETASASARLASARLLALRHGRAEDDLRARIADEALARRIRVVLEPDPSAAAEELETAPPLFELVR